MMGDWYDDGVSTAEWLATASVMVLSWAVLAAVVVWAVRALRSGRDDDPRAGRAGHAEQLLSERFARGEISPEEFASARELLQRPVEGWRRT